MYDIDFQKNGLIPVIVQNHSTLEVLMLGYMNEAALQKPYNKKKFGFLAEASNACG